MDRIDTHRGRPHESMDEWPSTGVKTRPTQPTKSPMDKISERAAVPHESFEPLSMMT